MQFGKYSNKNLDLVTLKQDLSGLAWGRHSTESHFRQLREYVRNHTLVNNCNDCILDPTSTVTVQHVSAAYMYYYCWASVGPVDLSIYLVSFTLWVIHAAKRALACRQTERMSGDWRPVSGGAVHTHNAWRFGGGGGGGAEWGCRSHRIVPQEKVFLFGFFTCVLMTRGPAFSVWYKKGTNRNIQLCECISDWVSVSECVHACFYHQMLWHMLEGRRRIAIASRARWDNVDCCKMCWYSASIKETPLLPN